MNQTYLVMALIALPKPVLSQVTADSSAIDPPSIRNSMARQPFPIQYLLGLTLGFRTEGANLAISYRFSKGIEFRKNRLLEMDESFFWYPTLTLGFLNLQIWGSNSNAYGDRSEIEDIVYGLIEGHRYWATGKVQKSVFVGAGLGGYRGHSGAENIGGIGPVFSAGAQARVWRLLGGLRLYRTPGLGNIATVAILGYQPKSFKQVKRIAQIGVVVLAVVILKVVLIPGN